MIFGFDYQSQINESRMFVIDPLLQKQIDYMAVLVIHIYLIIIIQKEDDIVIPLSKEAINCEKEVVVFICQNIVSTTRLVGYQIRTLKEQHVHDRYSIITYSLAFNSILSLIQRKR